MSFSSDQKIALKSIFKSNSFSGLFGGQFKFKAGPKPTTMTNFLKTLGSPDCFEEHPCLVPLAMAILKKSIPAEDLMEVVKEWTNENKRKLPQLEMEEEEGEEGPELGAFMKTLIPVINVSVNAPIKKRVILLDPTNGNRPVSSIDMESFLAVMGLSWKGLAEDGTIQKVFTCFDPYVLKYVFRKDTKDGSLENALHINYYIPPRWRFVDVAPAYEGFIKGLIDHLFPNEDEKEYVLDWLHYALVKRNETVLCLIGARGTGKGILLNNILAPLVGEEYHTVAKQEVLTEKFNSEFKDRRIVYFDEVNVSGDRELNKFRQLCNETISIETKGVDAEKISSYVSMALSSNDKKDFKAEPQERRFSVPEVTSKPLYDKYTEEEIEEFCIRIKDLESEEIAAFGNWLIERVPTFTAYKPLRGKYYFNLCRLSMSEWRTVIVESLLNTGEVGTPVFFRELLLKFKEGKENKDKIVFPKSTTVQAFLDDYSHEAVCRMGEVVSARDRNGKEAPAIMPNEDFLKKFGKKYKQIKAEDEL